MDGSTASGVTAIVSPQVPQTEDDPTGRVTLAPQEQVMVSIERHFIIWQRLSG